MNNGVGSGVGVGLDRFASNFMASMQAVQQMQLQRQKFTIDKKMSDLQIKKLEFDTDPVMLEQLKKQRDLETKSMETLLSLNEHKAKTAMQTTKQKLDQFQERAESVKRIESQDPGLAGRIGIDAEGNFTASARTGLNTMDIFGGGGITDSSTQISTPEEREAFIQQMPEGPRSVVKGLTDYTLDLNKITSLRGNQRFQLAQAAKIYDPTFDMTEFPTRQAFRKEFSSGKMGGNIRSFNTAIQHLAELDDTIDETPSSQFRFLQRAQRGYAKEFAGKSKEALAMRAEDAAITAVSGELATIFKNTGGTDQEIEKWFKSYDKDAPKEAKKVFIKQGIKLMQGRLGAIDSDFERVMGKKNQVPLMSPETKEAVSRLMGEEGGSESDTEIHSFETEADVEQANLEDGTPVMINGKKFIWKK